MLVAATGACDKAVIPVEPGGEPIVGDFNLISVDVVPLPIVTAEDADSVAHLVEGRFTMKQDHSFLERYTITLSRNGQIVSTTSESYAGVYRNETVRILFGGEGQRAGDKFEGSIKGDTLILRQSGAFYRFLRETASAPEGR